MAAPAEVRGWAFLDVPFRMRTRLLALSLLLATCRTAEPPRPPEPPAHTPFGVLLTLPSDPADERTAYGAAAQQFGELRLPAGAGPFPLVVLVHGGCWRSAFDLVHAAPAASALTRAGFATWLIEYRRIGDPGGAWPGTFDDVERALDFVPRLAERHPVDRSRVVLVGHSAGGQLVLFAAGRRARSRDATGIRGVVSLAGITDLRAYASSSGCGSAVAPLLGSPPDSVAARRAVVSPMERGAVGVPLHLVHGDGDPIVPVAQSRAYADSARARGDAVTLSIVPGVGHFDLVDPRSRAWPVVVGAIRAMLGAP